MSYQSRVYRQRNPRAKDEGKKDAFFSKHDDNNSGKKSPFFQAKLAVNEPGDSHEKQADAMADSVVARSQGKPRPAVQQKEEASIQRLATTKEEEQVSSNDERIERDKEKPFQRKTDEPEKDKKLQSKEMPEKEKEKTVQKKEEQKKEEDKKAQKKEEPEKEKKIQKKEEPEMRDEEKKKPSPKAKAK